MKFTTQNKISEFNVNPFNKDITFELIKRLNNDNDRNKFYKLRDRNLLTFIASNRKEANSDYINRLNSDHFDEK